MTWIAPLDKRRIAVAYARANLWRTVQRSMALEGDFITEEQAKAAVTTSMNLRNYRPPTTACQVEA